MSFKLIEIWHDVVGATAVEYGLIAALAALAMIGGLNSVSVPIQGLINFVFSMVAGAGP